MVFTEMRISVNTNLISDGLADFQMKISGKKVLYDYDALVRTSEAKYSLLAADIKKKSKLPRFILVVVH